METVRIHWWMIFCDERIGQKAFLERIYLILVLEGFSK